MQKKRRQSVFPSIFMIDVLDWLRLANHTQAEFMTSRLLSFFARTAKIEVEGEEKSARVELLSVHILKVRHNNILKMMYEVISGLNSGSCRDIETNGTVLYFICLFFPPGKSLCCCDLRRCALYEFSQVNVC